MPEGTNLHEIRVLVLALTSRDAANTSEILSQAGLACKVCRDTEELRREAEAGVGAIILSEESMIGPPAEALAALVRAQPHWSVIPFVVLTRSGRNSPGALNAMRRLGNVITLERPVLLSTFVTAARAAVRDRARQYQTRAHLAELEESDRRKNEFLAMLAHELRNPLAPIRNAMQVLRLQGADPQSVEWARELVDRQVLHLTRLIDDLLDVSRITRGAVALKKETVQLGALLARAIETSRPLIDARKQELSVSAPEHPVSLNGDMTRLVQAVSNLLNNASKYTAERGHLSVDAVHEGETVTIRVRDDGIGIPRDMLAGIFELFTQVDTSIDRSEGGLGIGLTLVRSIVQMHGGTVRADSAGPGTGSEFTIVLPADAKPEQMAANAPPRGHTAGQQGRRLLLVDDNADAGDSLATLLELSGYEVRTARSGVLALEALEKFEADVVLLDISLPGMDGYEIARRIRLRERGQEPLLLALTGYGGDEVKERARVAGFDHYVTKPADLDELQAWLASSLRVQ
jgi:signal transduction histidine kinase/CheY-like chemotaxis protein